MRVNLIISSSTASSWPGWRTLTVQEEEFSAISFMMEQVYVVIGSLTFEYDKVQYVHTVFLKIK